LILTGNLYSFFRSVLSYVYSDVYKSAFEYFRAASALIPFRIVTGRLALFLAQIEVEINHYIRYAHFSLTKSDASDDGGGADKLPQSWRDSDPTATFRPVSGSHPDVQKQRKMDMTAAWQRNRPKSKYSSEEAWLLPTCKVDDNITAALHVDMLP